ncbi:MAG: hydrogenase maturation nickel metallochaperone HypA [Flavobacteriaceae bacterium]|nr:hydrogenase maturation nickel metallochaperone HypA [Bacteroidia bacterium]NNF82065.1 hydrogenase maturation nickel metallochaperone HypA [Flavobacteriaceae bacterium]NNL80066.1 hydrogenase maturation nickel metallochaperone HypA [Flavobacteriaceae bacterium]
MEFNSLDFVWPSAVENTILHSAKRTINTIPGQASCLECHVDFKIENHFDNCPECGSPFKEIVQGRELRVKSLLVS